MKLTLIVTPEGKCLLAADQISERQADLIRREWANWSRERPLLVAGADIVRVEAVELALDGAEKAKPKRAAK